MMKNILVPVDFSKPSENALHVAVELAKDNDAKITILHVMELAESVFGSTQFNTTDDNIIFFMKLAKKKFDEFLNLDFLEGVEHNDVVDVGPTAQVIINNVKKQSADIVVMGSTGASKSFIDDVFVGSNTEKLVGGTDVPVLVVKDKMKNFNIKNVLFGSNFKEESIPAFKKAKDFAESFGADLKLVYINQPGNQFRSSIEIYEQMRSFLHQTKTPINNKNIIIHSDYSLKDGVINAAKTYKADLITITTRGNSGFAHFFTGSVADEIVRDSSLPVLTFKF